MDDKKKSTLAVLGYTLFLENLAVHVGPTFFGSLNKIGYKDSMLFLSVHKDADLDHTKEGFEIFHTISDELKKDVKENYVISRESYKNMLMGVKDYSRKNTKFAS